MWGKMAAEPSGTMLFDKAQAIEIIGGTTGGTTGGTSGTINDKILKSLAEPCGTFAEPHTTLKGSAAAQAARGPFRVGGQA